MNTAIREVASGKLFARPSAVSGIARIRRQTLDDIPRRSARRFPSRIAIIDGATRLTFTEFDAAVDRVAAALADQGIAKGDRMALRVVVLQQPLLVGEARVGNARDGEELFRKIVAELISLVDEALKARGIEPRP